LFDPNGTSSDFSCRLKEIDKAISKKEEKLLEEKKKRDEREREKAKEKEENRKKEQELLQNQAERQEQKRMEKEQKRIILQKRMEEEREREREREKERERERERERKREREREKRQKQQNSAAAAEMILNVLQSGNFDEAQKRFRTALEEKAHILDLAAIRRLASAFTKFAKLDLNIRKVIIKEGSNEDIIPMVLALIPCVSESNPNLSEALIYCAKYQGYFRLFKAILKQLPTIKISQLPILGAIEHGDREMLALLLHAGACPNFDRGPFGVTALHAAIPKGEEWVKMLLLAGADCNVADSQAGSTPLHEACKISDAATSRKLVALMIEHGKVNVSIKNKQKKTALQIAQHQSVKEMLTHLQQADIKPKMKLTELSNSKIPKERDSISSSVNAQQAVIPSPHAIQNKSVTEKKEDAKPLLTVEQRLRAMHSSLELSLTCKEQRKYPAVNDKITACNKKRPFEMNVEDSLTKRANISSVVDAFDPIVSVVEINEPNAQEQQAAEEEYMTFEEDISATIVSSEAAWDLRFTREFKEQLFALHRQPIALQSLLRNLGKLAAGEFSRGLYKQLKGVPKSLRIYESPVKTFNDGGRFLWQFAVDYR
jgi:hypothetical protein